MKIAIIIEGKTETAFMPFLREFLRTQLADRMPNLDTAKQNGRVPKGDKLKKLVETLLSGRDASDHVIALTDVYTGTNPPDFKDAADAKQKMRGWVGPEPRFHPHAAQHDFEAWLLPYWPSIQRLAGHNRSAPSGNPERVNHSNPPAFRIAKVFEMGTCRDSYAKTIHVPRILRDPKNGLSVAIGQCAELKAFINTILTLSGGTAIP